MRLKRIFIAIVFVSFGFMYEGIAQLFPPVFIGVQPSFTKEKYYEKDAFDINIIPLVLQTKLNRKMDVRFVTLINYHFGNEKGLNSIGFELLVPYYLLPQDYTGYPSYGLYIAPVGAYSINPDKQFSTVTLAVEPGYIFIPDQRFTLSLGIQAGASHMDVIQGEDTWQSHYGMKVNIGIWLGEITVSAKEHNCIRHDE